MCRCQNDLLGQRGTFAMIFALLLIPVIGFIGIAVDTARLYAVKQSLQHCLDSAVLAGGRTMYLSDRDQIIQRYFDQNWRGGLHGAQVGALVITPDIANGTITVAATATVDLLLLPVLGFSNQTVATASEIKREDSTLEAALVLDVSGSMLDYGTVQKITSLKAAAVSLVDILYPGGAPDSDVGISVVPWDHNVKVGTSYDSSWLVAGSDTTSTYTTAMTPMGGLYQTQFSNPACPVNGSWGGYPTVYFDAYQDHASYTGEYEMRPDPFDRQEDSPLVRPFSPTLCWQRDLYRSGALVCADYFSQCLSPNHPNTALPLTDDPALIKAHINGLRPAGATNSLTGLFWGWMTISPNWRGLWNGVPASQPYDYNEPHNYKAIILMTDGLNNNMAAYDPLPPGTTAVNSVANAIYINARSNSICTDLKANGVKIYTVGFDLDALSLVDRNRVEAFLSNCATSTGNYFPAPDGVTLNKAFQTIASDLAALRINQ